MEHFHYRHSQLRQVIERSFGVLKKRFPFLKKATELTLSHQFQMIYSCIATCNFIRMYNRDHNIQDIMEQQILQEVDDEMLNNNNNNNNDDYISEANDVALSRAWRNTIRCMI